MTQGLLKPLVFAFVVSLMGCYYGLRTTGGTQGVGRSTTQAMVVATVLIFVLDLLITKIFVSQAGSLMPRRKPDARCCVSKTSPSRSMEKSR